jgi:hypothetical protein
MRAMPLHRFPGAILLVAMCFSLPVQSESDLITWQGEPGSIENPLPEIIGVKHEWPIGLNLRGIIENAAARAEIRVELPDVSDLVFTLRNFDASSGFITIGDGDELDIAPDPNVPDSELSYSWYGASEHYQMTISVWRGRMSATVQTAGDVYSIGAHEQQPVLRSFDRALLLGEPDLESSEGLVNLGIGKPLPGPVQELRKSGVDTIDILVLHTPDALAALGNDQAQLDATVAEAFQQLSQSFENSGISTVRVRNVLAAGPNLSESINYNENSGWTCAGTSVATCRWIGHRVWLRTDSTVQALRNSYGADIVVMIVADSAFGGLAYTQRPNCGNFPLYEATTGCTVGSGYEDFAYAVIWVGQINVYQVMAHEVGHVFGMDHTASSEPTSYNWSFAKVIPSTVQTALGNAAFPRSLQYSNPNILFIGNASASGDTLRFNARTGYCLAPVMSGYRTPGQILRLFWDGFEDFTIPTQGC